MGDLGRVQLGDRVRATADIFAGRGFKLVATAGDEGRVVGLLPGELPTILWERTRLTADCLPEEEFQLVSRRAPRASPPPLPARLGVRRSRASAFHVSEAPTPAPGE